MSRMSILLRLAFAAVLALSLPAGCSTQNSLTAYYDHKTQVVRMEADGSCVVTAWGEGRSRAAARRDAKKRAVEDVLFARIEAGNGGQSPLLPLLTEPGVREKNARYFTRFFRNGGKYRRFCKEATRRNASEKYYKNEMQVVCKMTVSVDRWKLRKRLEADGIINSQDKDRK